VDEAMILVRVEVTVLAAGSDRKTEEIIDAIGNTVKIIKS